MFLIKNNEEKTIGIGTVMLQPGVNPVDPRNWQLYAGDKKWQKAISGMVKDERIKVINENEKVTIELVQNTYSLELLNEWLESPKIKGPLKGAVKQQIEKLAIDEDL